MIQQGHKYDYFGRAVIAIEQSNQWCWRVREIGGEFLMGSKIVDAYHLKPLPMKYFHGHIPK